MSTAQARALTPRVFYGWRIVVVTVVGLVFGYSSLLFTAFGLFVTSLEAEFGWSRAAISLAVTLAAGMVIVLSPAAGKLVDRYGVRRVLLPSMAALGVCVCALSTLDASLWRFYATFVLIAATGLGTLPVVYCRLVLNWFDRQRGLALGIALSGVGLAGVVLPGFVQTLIEAFGWRAGYLGLGLATLGFALPLLYWVVRDTPAEMGLVADGVAAEPIVHCARAAPVGLSLREAIGGRPFWQMLVAFTLLGALSLGFVTHVAAMLADLGASRGEIASFIAVQGASLIAGRIACGLLIDRFFAPAVAAVLMLLPAIGLALLASGSSGFLMLSVVLIGVGLGAELDLMAYLVSRYVGLASFGAVYGLIYGAFGIGAALGPPAMGLAFDRFGSYSQGLWSLALAPLLAVLSLALLGPYRYPGATRN